MGGDILGGGFLSTEHKQGLSDVIRANKDKAFHLVESGTISVHDVGDDGGSKWGFDSMGKGMEEAYILTWTGNKIPRGVEIKGKKVVWTQNGVVTAEDSSVIGTYDRITEWGG